MPDYKPPEFTYTPEEFTVLVDECIEKCKQDKDKEDGYVPCPEQLYWHTNLSKQTISGYRNAKEADSTYPYRQATEKWYNFMGIEGNRDYLNGNGKYGNHINKCVLKYSETTDFTLSGKEDNPLQILIKPVDITKPKDSESGTAIDL